MRIESDILKTAAAVAVLIGVYGGVVFWPAQKQNKALADEISQKRSAFEQMHKPDLEPVRNQIIALSAELSERSVALPVGEMYDRVLGHVSDTLLANSITQYETSYNEAEVYKRFAVTPIVVSFESQFPRAFEVIRQIEHDGPPVRIERVELDSGKDETSGYVKVRLEMSAFFLPEGDER